MPAWLASTQIKSAARGFRPPSLTRHNLLDGFGRHSGCCCDCLRLLRLLESRTAGAQSATNSTTMTTMTLAMRRCSNCCPSVCLPVCYVTLYLARPSLGLALHKHTLQLDICLNTVNTHKANRKSPHTADRRVGDSFDWFMAASECSSKWERQHSNGIRWQFRDINLSNRLTGASSDLDLELVLSCLLSLLDYYSIATFIGRIHRTCNIAMKSASGFVVPNKMCF